MHQLWRCFAVLLTIFLVRPASGQPPREQQKAGLDHKAVSRDHDGDPLPPGAIDRLGSARFRKGFFISQAEFSRDGKRIATAGAGQGVIVWDAASGAQVLQLSDLRHSRGLAYSPDGRLLASSDKAASGIGEELVLYDALTGRVARRLDKLSLNSVAFSPDGRILASAGPRRDRPNALQFWEVASGKLLREIPCPKSWPSALAFSPDGKTLLGCDPYGPARTVVHLWDAASGKVLPALVGPDTPVHAAAFSPDNKTIVSGSEDGSIRFWDYASRKQLRGIETKHGSVGTLSYSADGRLLASGHQDGNIMLWDLATDRSVRTWQAHSHGVHSVRFSPDGKSLLSTGGFESGPRLWDQATGKEIHALPGHRGIVDWLAFAPDGKTLFSLGRERKLLGWDLASGSSKTLSELPYVGVGGIAVSFDHGIVAAISAEDGSVRVWDVAGTKEPILLGNRQPSGQGPSFRSYDVCFSANGRWLAASIKDKAHVWDLSSRQEAWQTGSSPRNSRLAFSPDSTVLALLCDEGGHPDNASSLRFLEVATGKELRKTDAYFRAGALAFSADGRWLASSGYWQDPLQVWDLTTGKTHLLEGAESAGNALAFSGDSKLLAAGGEQKDPTTRVWDLSTGKQLARFDGHDSAVGAIGFSPDGRTLVTGSGNATILVWDLAGKLPKAHAGSAGQPAVSSTQSLLAQWPVAAAFRYPEAKHGKGELKYINGLPVLMVQGTPEEIGAQVGMLALRPAAADINYGQLVPAVLRSHNIDKALPLLKTLCNALFQRFPKDFRLELEAMAKASGVDRDLLVIVNVAPDIYNMAGCSTLIVEPGRSATGKPLFGRNLDTAPVFGLYKYGLVTVYRPDGKHAYAGIGVPGTVGPRSMTPVWRWPSMAFMPRPTARRVSIPWACRFSRRFGGSWKRAPTWPRRRNTCDPIAWPPC